MAGCILIGVGSNLASDNFGPPVENCKAALVEMENSGIRIVRRSRWYRSEPVPKSDQPWFVNGVVRAEAELSAVEVLATLNIIERAMGRVRLGRNRERTIDLDLLAFGDRVSGYDDVGGDGIAGNHAAGGAGDGLILPHPRLHERAFVLLPLAEIAPHWRHPIRGETALEMRAGFDGGQCIELLT